MRKDLLAIIFCAIALFHVWFASQLNHYSLANVKVELEAFSFEREKENLRIDRVENIVNHTSRIDEDFLNLSCYRESEHFPWSIFEVSIDTNIPLRKDLNVSFSLHASQLNLSTDCAYVSLVLADGERMILLGYYLGYQLPEWRFLRDYYVSYEVSGVPNTWISGRRNMWSDLTQKNLPLTRSLNIIKASAGILSYHPAPQSSDSKRMQAMFNTTKNALFYERSSFVKITPSSYQFPSSAVLLIATDLFLLVLFAKMAKNPKAGKHLAT
ncbi:MAG: hypothetical protein PVF15_09895 [Candidatus Bathyarchaeota archaeon]|jgi:hypothetical protein